MNRAFLAAVAVALTVAGSGCAASSAGNAESAGDCQAQVRLDGVTYTSYGYTDRQAKRFGTADEAECHDTGSDAPGSVFPADPRPVTVWTFAGYSPSEVLGVRFDETSFAVFSADSLPSQEVDRILAQLNPSASN